MKRIVVLTLTVAIILVALSGCRTTQTSETQKFKAQTNSGHADKIGNTPEGKNAKNCAHNWERIENLNAYTAVDKCSKCDETRKYTDPDSVTNTGTETAFKMLRYNWDGYGISTKEIFASDLGNAIIDCLSKLEETGITVPKISDDPVDETAGSLPVTPGTVWIECGTVGLFRLNPEMNEICKVKTHLGEGTALKMTDTLEELLGQAWYYFPYDYWSGKYENGTVTLSQVYKRESVVEYVKIDSIHIGENDPTSIRITLTIGANDHITTICDLFCSNGGDVIGLSDRRLIELLENKETQVELITGGLYGDWTHYVTITIDNTRINLKILP